jgi:selenocysteine lyase/cysteine desulfurase
VRDALWFDHGIEIAVLARDGALWARVSAQVYNDDEDLERLGDAVDALARR